MTKLIYMNETLNRMPKEEWETIIPLGEIKVDEKEVPYLVIELKDE